MSSLEPKVAENRLSFNIEEFLSAHRFSVMLFLLGFVLIGVGLLVFKGGLLGDKSSVEVIDSEDISGDEVAKEVVVEVVGAVIKPGVYTLPANSRVEDLLTKAGGVSADADREWVDRFINKASKLTDGQKIFIPRGGEQSDVLSANNNGDTKVYQSLAETGSGMVVNVNTASQKLLEELPGIGPVYAQSIIDHRPYSSVDELLTKGALKKNVFEKIKDLVAVY